MTLPVDTRPPHEVRAGYGDCDLCGGWGHLVAGICRFCEYQRSFRPNPIRLPIEVHAEGGPGTPAVRFLEGAGHD